MENYNPQTIFSNIFVNKKIMMEQKLTYRLEESDFVAVAIYSRWSSPERKRFRTWMFVLVSVTYMLFGYSLVKDNPFTWKAIVYFGLLGVLVWYLPVFMKKGIRKAVKRQYKKYFSKQFGLLTIHFTDNAIETSGDGTSGKVEWKIVKQISNLESHLIIGLQDSTGLIIPKRVFANEQEFDGFYHQLLEKISLEDREDG